MKQNLFYSLVCFACLAIACNTNETEVTSDVVNNPNTAATGEFDPEKAPIMTFEEESFEFGDISQGEKVQHSFKFKNTGKSDLLITSAQGSCGCTVPKWPKNPIAPGDEGVVDVVFDSNGKSGKQHKKVTIVANSQPSTNVVAITGNVIAPEEPTEK